MTQLKIFSKNFFLTLGLFAVAILIYSPIFQFQLSEDDWAAYSLFRGLSIKEFLVNHFLIRDGLVYLPVPDGFIYRPLQKLYLFLQFHFLDIQMFVHHAFSIFLLFLSAFTVKKLAEFFLKDDFLSWIAAFLYLQSVTIHLRCLVWLVGINDSVPALCLLIIMKKIMEKNWKMVPAWFASALFFKESSGLVLGLMMLWGFLQRKSFSPQEKASFLKMFLYTCVVVAVYMALKIFFNQLPANFEIKSIYSFEWDFSSLANNALRYLKVFLHAILPILNLLEVNRMILVFYGLMGLGAAWIWIFNADKTSKQGIFSKILLGAWFLLFMAPFIPIKNVFSEYYAKNSLVPFTMILIQGLMVILRALKQSQLSIRVFFTMLCLLQFGSAVYAMHISPRTQDGMFKNSVEYVFTHQKIQNQILEAITHPMDFKPTTVLTEDDGWLYSYRGNVIRGILHQKNLPVMPVENLEFQNGKVIVQKPLKMDFPGLKHLYDSDAEINFETTKILRIVQNQVSFYPLDQLVDQRGNWLLKDRRAYTLGEWVTSQNIESAFWLGWEKRNGLGRSSRRESPSLLFRLENLPDTISLCQLSFEIRSMGLKQVEVSVNGQKIGTVVISGQEESKIHSLSIPAGILKPYAVNTVQWYWPSSEHLSQSQKAGITFISLQIQPLQS